MSGPTTAGQKVALDVSAHLGAIEAFFDAVSAGLAPELERRSTGAVQAQTIIAEQFLRSCLEVALNRSTPFDPGFLCEIAVRLSAYCVTAAPEDEEARLILAVCANLTRAVQRKRARGFVISTVWGPETPPLDPSSVGTKVGERS